MAQVINEKSSSLGSPTMIYNLYLTPSERTATTVKISYEMRVRMTSSESWSGTNVNFNAIINVGGTTKEFQFKFPSDVWSGTATHTFTGSFVVSASAGLTSLTTSLRTYSYGYTSTAGGTLYETAGSNLTIPVGAPTFTLRTSNLTGGSAFSINYTAITGQTYKFSIKGNTSGNYYVQEVATHSWTANETEAWANNLINRMSETCTITCDTYSGATKIYTATLTLTYNVKAYSITGTTHTITNIDDLNGKLAQNKSKVKVLGSGATSQYGATITYKHSVGGIEYQGTEITSDVISASGNVIVKTTATDSRGKTQDYSTTIVVNPYSAPVIRSISPSTINDIVHCDVEFSFSSIQGENSISLDMYISNTLEDSDSGLTESPTELVSTNEYPPNITYQGRIIITDLLGTSTEYEFVVPTDEVPININPSKKGVAFGKVSEGTDGLVEIAWNLNIGSEENPVEALLNGKDIITEDSTAKLENVRLNLDTSSPSSSGTIDQQITYYLTQLGWLNDVID